MTVSFESRFSRNSSIAILAKEMSYLRYRTSYLEQRFLTCQGNSGSSCWSIPFFTVERKGEKREKLEVNIYGTSSVLFSQSKIKTSRVIVFISYFGSVYLQECFFYDELLAGINYFFLGNFAGIFFFGKCHPPFA